MIQTRGPTVRDVSKIMFAGHGSAECVTQPQTPMTKRDEKKKEKNTKHIVQDKSLHDSVIDRRICQDSAGSVATLILFAVFPS